MASLPLQQTKDLPLSLLQTAWKAILDPIVSSPSNNVNLIKNVSLINGVTTINHKLGQKLTGYRIVRQRAAASIYDNQDNNTLPDKTLILVSNAAVVVDIEVF